MKCLSIRQPWASLIIENIKDIENRTWKTKFRGTVLVHTCAWYSQTPAGILTTEQWLYSKDKEYDHRVYSAIIGTVDIIDCVINHKSIWAEKIEYPNWTELPLIYNWVLANPVKFDEPILNVKGKLSFWDYDLPADYLKLIK